MADPKVYILTQGFKIDDGERSKFYSCASHIVYVEHTYGTFVVEVGCLSGHVDRYQFSQPENAKHFNKEMMALIEELWCHRAFKAGC